MEFHGHVREILPYDHKKHTGGYGFIQTDDNQSIFFLLAWANYEPVKVGDFVEFEKEYDENNRLHANPVGRDVNVLSKKLKQLTTKYEYKNSRRKVPVPNVKIVSTNMSAAYEYLNNIQQKFGNENNVLPATMLSTINEWISSLADLNNKFSQHETLKELLVKRNILPKQKQIPDLEKLQADLRKMNYEQRGRYYGVRGEQIVQTKLEQHHLKYIQNPTLPEFDNQGNVVGATEIDFIVVSMFGIHVIEVKNYGANKNSDQILTISRDGQWSRIGSSQENVTNQNDIHIAAVEDSLFKSEALKNIGREKLLATPIYVIPNDNVEIRNQSKEEIVRTGFLYDTLSREVRLRREVVLTDIEVETIIKVLDEALANNREFQYLLPNEDFLEDAYELKRRYDMAQYVYQNIDSLYK